MKKLCLLLLLSLAAAGWAENPPSPAPSQIDKPAYARQTVQADTASQQDHKVPTRTKSRRRETPLHVEKPAANETSHGRLRVDGILVQLVNTDNPFQLINPAAPERYGSAEDNVVRDPTSGRISGLKFLELRF